MPELPDDFGRSPIPDLQAKAWANNSERERLEELWRERDDEGERTWKQELRYEADGWTELWLVPEDPRDPRQPERVGSWHTETQEVAPLKDAQAIVDEHHTD
jgi:hypothetical protein